VPGCFITKTGTVGRPEDRIRRPPPNSGYRLFLDVQRCRFRGQDDPASRQESPEEPIKRLCTQALSEKARFSSLDRAFHFKPFRVKCSSIGHRPNTEKNVCRLQYVTAVAVNDFRFRHAAQRRSFTNLHRPAGNYTVPNHPTPVAGGTFLRH
jgi:hypothetical protein